jgi:hypothetical protein
MELRHQTDHSREKLICLFIYGALGASVTSLLMISISRLFAITSKLPVLCDLLRAQQRYLIEMRCQMYLPYLALECPNPSE